MALLGENQVRNFYIVNTSSNTTMANIRAGVALNGAIVQEDGTAAVADQPFMLAMLDAEGNVRTSDKVDPYKVSAAASVDFKPRVEHAVTVSDITATAGELYQIAVIFKEYGSLSVENEYIKKGFYKAKTGDTAEDVVDGLIKSLARSIARDQPSPGTTFTYNAKGGNIQLPDNYFLEFLKTNDDGAVEITTVDVTANATAAGNCTVTLDGTAYSIPVTVSTDGTFADTAAEIAEGINAIPGWSATSAVDTITVTADLPGVVTEMTIATDTATDLAFSAVSVTQDGTAGTAANSQLTIREKESWLSKYYVTGKKTNLNRDFEVQAWGWDTDPTITEIKGDPGMGSGYHVRNMEEYYYGNIGDTFRGAGYPHNFDKVYDSALTGSYWLIEVSYYDEGRDDPMKSKKQLTIACPSEAVANTLIGQINTALTNVPVSITAFPA